MSMNPNEGQGDQGYQGYSPPPPPPSEPPYGAPPTTYSPSAQAGGGLNVQDLLQRWRAVLMPWPNVATFDAQQPGANWLTIIVSLVALGVLQAIVGAIESAEYHSVSVIYGFGNTSSPAANVGNIIGTPIGFFIAAGILFFIAKLFGGTGNFLTYAWLLSLAYVPLSAIAAVAGIIPLLGVLIALAAGIYNLYLSVLATASAHRLTIGRSWLVVLIPAIVVFVLFFIIAIIIAAVFATSTR